MSAIGDVTTVSVDGELNDEDYDPLFSFVYVLANTAEDFTAWYEDSANDLEIASEWMSWISRAVADGKDISDESTQDLIDFTSWLDQTGLDYTKYFNTNDDGTMVEEIKSNYKRTEVTELIGLEVEAMSSDLTQVSLYTNAVIDDFATGNDELMSIIESFRSTGRGHIRA